MKIMKYLRLPPKQKKHKKGRSKKPNPTLKTATDCKNNIMKGISEYCEKFIQDISREMFEGSGQGKNSVTKNLEGPHEFQKQAGLVVEGVLRDALGYYVWIEEVKIFDTPYYRKVHVSLDPICIPWWKKYKLI